MAWVIRNPSGPRIRSPLARQSVVGVGGSWAILVLSSNSSFSTSMLRLACSLADGDNKTTMSSPSGPSKSARKKPSTRRPLFDPTVDPINARINQNAM